MAKPNKSTKWSSGAPRVGPSVLPLRLFLSLHFRIAQPGRFGRFSSSRLVANSWTEGPNLMSREADSRAGATSALLAPRARMRLVPTRCWWKDWTELMRVASLLPFTGSSVIVSFLSCKVYLSLINLFFSSHILFFLLRHRWNEKLLQVILTSHKRIKDNVNKAVTQQTYFRIPCCQQF